MKQKTPPEYMTPATWGGIIFVNLVLFITIGIMMYVAGVAGPFRKAIIPIVGTFLLTVIVVSNVKNQKPWTRFHWD